jgi:biotin carboxyl carrier protein
MTELESEELSIRNNASLSPAERQQQLQRVWSDQRDLIAGRAPSPTGTAPQVPANQPTSPTPEASASQSSAPAADSSKPQSSPSAPSPKVEEPKYATKVPGKNGWIRSPYDGKVLDAAGVPPGTQVKDPDSGKIMIVP